MLGSGIEEESLDIPILPLASIKSLSELVVPLDVLTTYLAVANVAPEGVLEEPVFTLAPVKYPLVTSAKEEVELYPAEYFTHFSQLDALESYL